MLICSVSAANLEFLTFFKSPPFLLLLCISGFRVLACGHHFPCICLDNHFDYICDQIFPAFFERYVAAVESNNPPPQICIRTTGQGTEIWSLPYFSSGANSSANGWFKSTKGMFLPMQHGLNPSEVGDRMAAEYFQKHWQKSLAEL